MFFNIPGMQESMAGGFFEGIFGGGKGQQGSSEPAGGKGKGKQSQGHGKSNGDEDRVIDVDEDLDEHTPSQHTRLYDLLEVSTDVSGGDLKKAYKKAAMKHHPDKGGDPDTFKDIQQAFEVLNDPDRRERYDRMGDASLTEDGPDANDIFGQFFGGKGRGGKGRGVKKTKDQVRQMWVSLEQIYTSCTRPLPISRKVLGDGAQSGPCSTCGGRGFEIQVMRIGPMVQQIQQACSRCGGTGTSMKMKTATETLDVFVEKGSPDGHKIHFHGKADEAPGHEPGDVVVQIRQQEHQRFMRKGADLYLERDVSLADALTGFTLVIPHLDGRKVVVRSKPGEVLRPSQGGVGLKAVPSCGMPIHQDPFNFGNLFLILTIVFPQSIDAALAPELRRVLGGQAEEADAEVREALASDDVEEAVVEDIDPLESAQRNKKPKDEAYEEDEDEMGPGGQHVQCKQQ